MPCRINLKCIMENCSEEQQAQCRDAAKITKLEIILPEIILPKTGKLISSFAKEIAEILKEKETIFFRPDAKDIVEITTLKTKDGEKFSGFTEITPCRFITLAEQYFVPGIFILNKEDQSLQFKKKSMDSSLAKTVLESNNLQQALPQIQRIFPIPIPIIYEGELTFPTKGYDSRFNSWRPFDSPEIIEPEMSLETAKKIIKDVFKEFCFQTKQDYYNAIAALLTPFLRGVFPRFNCRTPIFFYLANRERAGKDYLSGITGILYEGAALEEPPISTSENAKSNNNEELRKKILAAMIQGRKRMHFSNNKGHINNAVFESVATTEKFSDRLLGKNETLSFDNELDFSLSGNVGVGFTPDFSYRCVFIRLFLDIEDANARRFERPDLHQWVRENREKMLSALYSLVKNWIDKGKPLGTIPFASYPNWSTICGGIMETAGYGNPCDKAKEAIIVGGDSETEDMKQLFSVCYEKYHDQWIKKETIRYCISEETIFSYLDFGSRKDQTKFGQKIDRYIGRVLGDIRLIVKNPDERGSRKELKFTKEKQEMTILDF